MVEEHIDRVEPNEGPVLNRHEKRAAQLLQDALGPHVPAEKLEAIVHEIVLAGRSTVDTNGLQRDLAARRR